MVRNACRATGRLAAAVLIAALGCDRSGESPQPGQPTPPIEEKPPTLTIVAPESAAWSAEQALEKLSDEKLSVSAAVRLVRLSDAQPLCLPEDLTDATAGRLRLVALSDGVWALGLANRKDRSVLHAPVLIGADGRVLRVARGTEEETLTLHVAADADVFPHLLISPRRVWLAEVPSQLGLTLRSPPTVGFARREQEGYGYVGLMLPGKGKWQEVARYLWEPYELSLMGPASDVLPDPPGGKFILDMDGSPLLIPVGGEIPEPEPTPEEPPERARPDWLEA